MTSHHTSSETGRVAAETSARQRAERESRENAQRHAADTAKQTGEKARRDADELREHAEHRMSEAGERLRETVERGTGVARERIAEELHVIGAAARAAADQLSEDDHRRVGSYVRGITDACESAANYVENSRGGQIRSDARAFARDHPAVFVGALSLAGFALGRVLSAKPASHRTHNTAHTGMPDSRPYAGTQAAAPGPFNGGSRIPASPPLAGSHRPPAAHPDRPVMAGDPDSADKPTASAEAQAKPHTHMPGQARPDADRNRREN